MLQSRHLRRKHGTDARAVREEKIDNRNLSGHEIIGDDFAILIGKRKQWYWIVDGI
jgi:hypothetical protein